MISRGYESFQVLRCLPVHFMDAFPTQIHESCLLCTFQAVDEGMAHKSSV